MQVSGTTSSRFLALFVCTTTVCVGDLQLKLIQEPSHNMMLFHGSGLTDSD